MTGRYQRKDETTVGICVRARPTEMSGQILRRRKDLAAEVAALESDPADRDEMLAVAAYNGGLANVDSWVTRANAAGRALTVAAIPFAETRDYVQRVLQAQQAYRATYPRELGLQ